MPHTVVTMDMELRVLTAGDVHAHNAGEDDVTFRWLTGRAGTPESTARYFALLRSHLQLGEGIRGFGVWLEGKLAGYVDCNPDVTDGLEPGDVNITYAIHPWARGRGVAVAAVTAISTFIRDQGIGTRAAIRVDPGNLASIRVAEKCGFRFAREFISTTDTLADGSRAVLRLYLRDVDD